MYFSFWRSRSAVVSCVYVAIHFLQIVLHIFLLCFDIKCNLFFYFHRLNSIDVKYQMWKLGVVFTDNVSLSVYIYIQTHINICIYSPAKKQYTLVNRKCFKGRCEILWILIYLLHRWRKSWKLKKALPISFPSYIGISL